MSLGRSEDTGGANASMSASRSGVAPDSSAASRADSDSSYLRRVYSSANSIDTTERLLTASVIRSRERGTRTEERGVGKEGGSTCRSRWSLDIYTKNTTQDKKEEQQKHYK